MKLSRYIDSSPLNPSMTSDEVRAAIHALIAAEDAHAPLSDAHIADLLAERGITAARRTVMKYREQLGIPSSTKRRRY